MKKRLLPIILILASCLVAPAQNHNADRAYIKKLGSRARSIDAGLNQYNRATVEIGEVLPEADFRKVTTYSTKNGKPAKVVTELPHDDGGRTVQTFYYDESGKFETSLMATHSFGDDGTHHYNDETFYFRSKKLVASNSRHGSFKKGEKFDNSKIRSDLGFASETDIPLRETYEYHRRRAQMAERLVRGLAVKDVELPGHALLNTISPNGRYIVKWARDDDGASFSLVDLVAGETIGKFFGGASPLNSSVYYDAEWSANSKRLVFWFDSRWTTMSGELFAVSPDAVKSLGDLYENVGKLAYSHLKTKKHPYVSDQADSVHGFMKVLAVEGDGPVQLVLSTQSKQEGPENNFDTEMTVFLKSDGSARADGVRLLSPGEDPQEYSAGEIEPEEAPKAKPTPGEKEESGFVITARKIGPITQNTPFNLKAVRKLFPEHRTVASSETFEEGGEQTVIHVIGKEPLLTLVPIPDKAELSYVYTTNPAVATQLGFAVGDSFGEVFEKTPEHAYYEGISGEVVTEAPGIDNVRFRFSPEQGNPDGDGLPRYSKLKTWKLYSIEWSPAKG